MRATPFHQVRSPRFRTAHRPLAVLGTVLLLWGCSEHEFHPPDSQERVAAADTVFADLSFDTLTWESEDERLFAGNLVYATTCRRCHGSLGLGDTDYARNRNLEIPSLVEPGWALADSLDGVRHRVFVGHEGGMPVFQLSGLSMAEVDAVSAYVLYQLRPDVLGQEDRAGASGGSAPGG